MNNPANDHQAIEETNSTEKHQWWRWILMPFASIGGGAVCGSLFGLFHWLHAKYQGGYSEDGWFYLYILPLISSAAFGFFVAKFAFDVAPTGKLVAAVVMVTVVGMLALVCVSYVWLAPSYQLHESMRTTLNATATLTASILYLVYGSK